MKFVLTPNGSKVQLKANMTATQAPPTKASQSSVAIAQLAKAGNPALARLAAAVSSHENVDAVAYSRMHHRHNRS